MMKNTATSYGIISRSFHWLMSLMIICLLCVGFYMAALPNSPDKFQIYGIHKATGVIVLSLGILRLIWRFFNIEPDFPSTVPVWETIAYKLSVRLMYVLMLGMPITGITMTLYSGKAISVFGLFTIPALVKNDQISYAAWQMHGICAWVFVAFISVHILMSLYHHFIVKDKLLKRMIVGE